MIISTIMGTNLNQETKGYVKGYKIYNDKIYKINPDPEAFRHIQHKIVVKWSKPLKLKITINPYIRYNSGF